MKRTIATLSLVVGLFALTAHAVQGTRVTSGGLSFASGVGHIDMSGQSGLHMTADVDSAGGVFLPENQCSDLDCTPGTQVNLNAHWTGSDVRGTASLRGQDYVLGTEDPAGAFAIVTFDGSLVLPDFNSTGTVDVQAPFTFSGQLTSQATSETERLFGSGVAMLRFRQSPDGSAWQFESATYQFTRSGATQ